MTTTPLFTEPADWEPLVDILRSELQEYGGMYNLLAAQQERIIERKPDAVLEINGDIEAQTRLVADLRKRREKLVREFAERAGVDRTDSLRAILPCFSEVVRPLLEALMRDINHMVRRNRRKARQNHLLLSRAMEVTEQTLRVLQPEKFTRTYGSNGKVAFPGQAAPTSRYHAIG